MRESTILSKPGKATSTLRLLALVILSAAAWAHSQTLQYSYDQMRRLTRVQYPDGSTIDYVYDNLDNRLIETTIAGVVPSNTPPVAVSSPGIPNGATAVSTTPTLNWARATDPDAGDTVAYLLHFGTTPNPPLAFSGFDTNWVPQHLQCFTTYYWYVVSRDNHNARATSPVWSFTTGSDPPQADFTASRFSGTSPLTIVFQDQSASACSSGVPTSWQWDFNNSGTVGSTYRNPTNTFTVVGDYSVKLTVRDQYGATGTIVKTNFISVLGPNVVDLSPQGIAVQSAASYGNLLINYTVANLSTTALAGQWQYADSLYVSPHPALDSSAILVASFVEHQSLPAQSQYSRTHLVSIPQNLPLDSYYVILKADGRDEIAEISEANNVLSIPLHDRLPDLVPGSLSIPGPAFPGRSIDIIYSGTNSGAIDIRSTGPAQWADTIYLSTNSVWTPSATFAGSAVQQLILAPGAGYRSTNSVWLPNWAPGNYFLFLRVNDPYSIVEDASNNTLSIPITLQPPPLRPLALNAPATGTAGQSIQFSYVATNTGSSSVTGIWFDMLWLSTSAVWNRNTVTNLDFEFVNGPLLPGGTYSRTNTVVLPPILPTGNYYLIVQVAADQATGNTDPYGTLAKPISVQAAAGFPDLSPIALNAPPSAAAGQTIQIVYAVTNYGPVAAAGQWFDELLLSTNVTADPNSTVLNYFPVSGPVGPATGYAQTNVANLPAATPGLYYLVVRVDAFNQTFDSVSTNNAVSVPLIIQPSAGLPDLAPVAIIGPASVAPGQLVQFNCVVTNLGAGMAVGPWFDELGLTTNGFWSPDAYALGFNVQNTSVPAYGGYSFTSSGAVPSWPPGRYYVTLNANAFGSFNEASTANNLFSVPLDLTPPNITPVLLGGQILPDRRFQLAVSGAVGTNYSLMASTNLTNWVRVLGFTCTNLPTLVTDPGSTNFSWRYYRAAWP